MTVAAMTTARRRLTFGYLWQVRLEAGEGFGIYLGGRVEGEEPIDLDRREFQQTALKVGA